VKVDDTPITSAAELGGVIRKYLPGDRVQIEVDRGGNSKTVTATLEEGPNS
jgi:S1-C subfamily serine protease